ncbi:unnamed protein product [Paramecium primaurelia]|uniref:Uncharacterized protein n=1 Tax=Paramecium primaurelia TaxID=5886 RepID=A0A8S1KUM5_PARPR|nr:unnamed protein product [Paramecium primaurelia]CAD8058938.1 unnamed protein product [Paramecium primaurelia]
MFSQGKNDKESKAKVNDNQINQKQQTKQQSQEQQELERQKFNNKFKFQYQTLMQIGMNGINFELMYNQNINSKISEIIGEVSLDGIKQ